MRALRGLDEREHVLRLALAQQVDRVRRARIGQPGVTGTAETGAILWPGT